MAAGKDLSAINTTKKMLSSRNKREIQDSRFETVGSGGTKAPNPTSVKENSLVTTLRMWVKSHFLWGRDF